MTPELIPSEGVPAPPREAVDAATANPGLPIVSHSFTPSGERAGICICIGVHQSDDPDDIGVAVASITTPAAVAVAHDLLAHAFALGWRLDGFRA